MDKYSAEQVLGLSGGYDAATLKAAFHKLAAANHPDAVEARGGDREAATLKMQEINQAHDELESLFAGGSTWVSCEKGPSSHATGYAAETVYNPFDGSRRHGAREGGRRRQTTAEYYAEDPRHWGHPGNPTRRGYGDWRDGARESASGKGSPVVEDPEHPNPRWYAPVHRFVAAFPYRIAFLLTASILIGLMDPQHMSHTLGPLTFEETLLAIALLNLVWPVLTSPIRALLIWLVDRLRDVAWFFSKAKNAS